MAAHPETLLLSSVLRQGDFKTVLFNGITSQMFHLHTDEFHWLEKYYIRFGRTPNKSTFKSKFPSFPIKAVDDVDHYVDEVKKAHARYMLSVAMDNALASAERNDIESAVKALHADVITIQSQVSGTSDDFDLVADWESVYRNVSARVSKTMKHGQAGLPTGFPTLDKLTGGPQPGEFWVVGARLGMGKTWTLIRMAAAALFAGHTVQYDALEQSRTQIAFRMHSFMSSAWGRDVFDSLALHKGRGFDLRSYKKFLSEAKEHVKGQMFICDTSRGRVSTLTIAAQIERNKPEGVYVDYLTLMEGVGEDWRATARLSSDIKSLTQRYDIPVICAAQINRAGSGKEPPRADTLSQSDAIGMDADCLVTMAKQSASVVKMRLAKYRHGSDGDTWFCEFAPGSGKYLEISGDDADDLIERDAEKQ